ncbi:MAG: hypothetical protein IPM48_09675 [Saprospiraceae bacterium]|nr:hypothetical protein [Saprospiraceae bacterium]
MDGEIITDFTIRQNNIFLLDNTLSEYALIENIAQSSAAGLCFIGIEIQSKPLDGFIGAISKLKLHKLAKLNDTIQTHVTPIQQFGSMFLIKGESYLGQELLLECEMKLVGI